MKAHPRLAMASRGFSLIEVMVAVLVISVGLLGIAKMQALSLSNTGNSRLRALAALEAASLASTMQANRSYWTTVPTLTADLTATVSGTSITQASDATLSTTQTCTGAATNCTPPEMAAYDFQQWVAAMNTVIQNDSASLDCTMPAAVLPATTSPVTCTITISWTENLVNSNSAQTVNATTLTALQTPTYKLIVQP